MAIAYFEIVLLYPVITGIIARLTLGTPLWGAIKSGYYLLIGYILAFTAVMLVFLPKIKFIGFLAEMVLFTLGYFAVFFIRAYIQTEQHDIFAAISPEKKA